MANRIQIRRDSEANWESINPVLADGEPGLNYDNNQVKYGDGESDWTTLTYSASTGNLSWGDDVRGSITDVISEGFQTGNLIIDSSNGSASGSVNRDIRLISHGPGGGTSNPHEWAFDSAGALTLPNGAVIKDTAGNGVSFGEGAGTTSQGNSAVAIGKDAGRTSQGNNSIIINATGANLDQTTANTFTLKPVRGDSTANLTGAGFKGVYYNSTTGEFCYSTD